jgi:hypothetical protein
VSVRHPATLRDPNSSVPISARSWEPMKPSLMRNPPARAIASRSGIAH